MEHQFPDGHELDVDTKPGPGGELENQWPDSHWEVAALSVDWDAHIVDIGEERKCDGFDGQDLFPKGG